uniref:Oligodendrocyte-myelin glycoprotein n=2 Tax=Pyxicephalus adspersus TaxID=30357 RepID=A0AAV3BAE4_PYXAD|nr:TPA: hypothetical protein GDO54_001036 [Pyxicephalus adspersus]
MKYRNVDCSGSSLTALPHGLQDNITHLNLSYNQLSDIDHQLTKFTNLRFLDLSHNLLNNLPSHLPRSLWELYASNNSIKVLHKLDTAYQWNLKVLDLSKNSLQRTVFINNTLISLQLLNLSFNQLWTVPTNMPTNILTIDLSNNYLIQILPGTLVRMTKLQKLFLHNNRFTYIPTNAFDHLTHLLEITLYNNPWSCKDTKGMNYIMIWSEENNIVNGSPCANERYEIGQFATENEVTTDNIPLFTTSHSPFLEVQEHKQYKKIQYPEDVTVAQVNASSIPHASTEDSLMIDGSSADEIIPFDFNYFGNEKDNQKDSKEIEETKIFDSTSIVRFDDVINDNNLTMSFTTVSGEIRATTVQLNDYAPSSAAQKEKCFAVLSFILLFMRTV